jgi:hypothetical protein
MNIHRFRKEVETLEKAMRPEPEDEAERQKGLKMVREAAEQLNESFYRDLAIERRTAFLENVGYEGHTSEDLRDENFLYSEDKPPFRIDEEGAVFSSRDGKPITEYAQTLAEFWYWEEVDERELYLIHDEEAETFYTPEGNLAISRDRVDFRHVLYAIGVLEREIEELEQ